MKTILAILAFVGLFGSSLSASAKTRVSPHDPQYTLRYQCLQNSGLNSTEDYYPQFVVRPYQDGFFVFNYNSPQFCKMPEATTGKFAVTLPSGSTYVVYGNQPAGKEAKRKIEKITFAGLENQVPAKAVCEPATQEQMPDLLASFDKSLKEVLQYADNLPFTHGMIPKECMAVPHLIPPPKPAPAPATTVTNDETPGKPGK